MGRGGAAMNEDDWFCFVAGLVVVVTWATMTVTLPS
jgi:hypothetical protein